MNPATSQDELEAAKPPLQRSIRPRVMVLILTMQVLLIWWSTDSEIAHQVYLVPYAIIVPAMLYLLVARLLERWLPFDRREILLVYIVLCATLPIIGYGGLRFLIPGLGYLPYFAQTDPRWTPYLPFLAHLPVLHDPRAIHDLYHGESGVPWRAWAWPITFWSAYLLLLSGVWFGLAALLHRIWIRQERLTFPITTLPVQLMDQHDDVFRRPLFWMGFAISAVLESLLVLNTWVPSVPYLPLGLQDVRPLLFTSLPWSAIPVIWISFFPLVIALAYFVPSSVSFSCWSFVLLTNLSCVVGASFGQETGDFTSTRFPYQEDQAVGAWIAFAVLALRGLRFHWRSLMQLASPDDRRGIVRMGFAAAVCALLCTVMMIAVGVTPMLAVGVIAFHIAYTLSGARVRAEAGGAWTFAPVYGTPYRMTNMLLGREAVTANSLVAGAHFDLIHVDIRAKSLPYLMEGLKIADEAGIQWKTVLKWAAVGTVTALALGWCASLVTFYHLGAATAKSDPYALVKANRRMAEMDTLVNSHGHRDWAQLTAVVFGALLTFLLAACRMRFEFFPFHPVGYVLCNTYTLSEFWVPFFIAWLVNVCVRRCGGVRLYRKSLGFFIGLLLGDIITQAIWVLMAQALRVPLPHFLD